MEPTNPLAQAADLDAVLTCVRSLLVASGLDQGSADAATVSATAGGYRVDGLTLARAYLIARSVLAECEAERGTPTVTVGEGSVTVTV